MESRAFIVSSPKNPLIAIKVIPGHFATTNSHISHYLDMSSLKTNSLLARDAARELAALYLASTLVDTIVCMEETQVIGAYLAEELLDGGTSVMNSGGNIHVVRPMSDVNGKLIFYSTTREMILNRNILLLVASVSSGDTVQRAMECLSYYGGKLVGISALFSAKSEEVEQEIQSLFTSDDIPGFQSFTPNDCTMCKEKVKIDAIVNSDGYTKI